MSAARDKAARDYMIEQKKTPGINPWRVFEAGWDAAKADQPRREHPAHDEVRSSGWVSGAIV